MEKSFLNFKAAHPDWTPNDPSGSLYLSRMADLTSAGLARRKMARRSGDFGMESTIMHSGKADGSTDRSAEHDRTLLQGQIARRRGSVLMQSRLGPMGSPSSIFQSNIGLGMAQTAVLGDSAGSQLGPPPNTKSTLQASAIPEEDLADDGGVTSALGESYVDGRPKGPAISQSQQEEDEVLEDGGVLALLAQIYGTTANMNMKGRGRGAP